jgi:hypothetical protein
MSEQNDDNLNGSQSCEPDKSKGFEESYELNEWNESNDSSESIDYFAMGWKDAKSFDDLCFLMGKSLCNELYFNSFVSFICEDTGCTLVEESMPYQGDFEKMNKLGFLTIDSQPGVSIERKINKEYNIPDFIRERSIIKKTGIHEFRELYEQRNYVKGFIKKDVVQKMLPKLDQYIVFISSCHENNCKIEISINQKQIIESKNKYFSFPKYYEGNEIDSKDYLLSCDYLSDKFCQINLSRYVYKDRIALPTNLQVHEDECYFNKNISYPNLMKKCLNG